MNGWTAVATAATLAPGGRIRVVLDGEEFVLWRSADGAPRLFSNRCPHRGMRLSFGFVRGDRLICPYHGWSYGPEGGCLAIPAHPDLRPPATIRVASRPVREVAGLVFATGGDPTGDPLPGVDGAGFRPCRSVFVAAPAAATAAALAAGAPDGWRARPSGDVIHLDGVRPGAAPVAALLAMQPLSPDVTAVHAAVEGDVATVAAMARWLAGHRDALEGAAP
jgi:nitrite reductase/ring-hydroxylating ferredoxin subunit